MKVLFVLAHPDDEAYGPYGTIVKHIQQGNDVSVYCLCDGSRPGAESVSISRVESFVDNMKTVGAKWKIWSNPDLTLTLKETTEFIDRLINEESPDIVYTHNISDLNRDHRIVAEACLVGCRPKLGGTVKQLLFFEIPASTDWSFNQLPVSFEPNTYIELGEDIIELKKQALSKYTTEIYEYPDARSIGATITLAKYRGQQVGYAYAEAFKLVFSKLDA